MVTFKWSVNGIDYAVEKKTPTFGRSSNQPGAARTLEERVRGLRWLKLHCIAARTLEERVRGLRPVEGHWKAMGV
jgi:hypothetical protein